MRTVDQALAEVRDLHEKIVGTPPPEIGAGSYIPFPAGVDPIDYAVEEVRQLRKIVEHQKEQGPPSVVWIPQADLFQSADGMVILFALPGLRREEISINVSSGQIIVHGRREPPMKESEIKPLAIETNWGAFERRMPLPAGISPSDISARYEDGILRVEIAAAGGETHGAENVEISS